jgi:hypothetical protein
MSAKEIFKQLLGDVVAGVSAIAVEVDRPADEEFVATAFAVLGLAISRLPAAQRENTLLGIEDGRALRQAVAMYPNTQSANHALH